MQRTILPRDMPVTTNNVRTAVASALHTVKSATNIDNQEMAERLGKRDRATASDLLAGECTMDLVSFITALRDPDFGAAFGNSVLSRTAGMNLCPEGDIGDGDLAGLPVNLSELLTTFLRAYADMRLDHQENAALAKLLRPMLPHFLAIIAEDDRRRS